MTGSMDLARSLLAQSLLERISPVIMLLPTLNVEESCQKNGISFLETIRPFSDIHQIDVPVRTASEQPYRLQEFRLRMFYASGLSQPTVENAEECLLNVVNNASDEALEELCGNPRDLEAIQKMAQSESFSSRFQRYSRVFTHSLAFSDHETFDHPVACMRIVSSRDENPIHKFVELYDSGSMPSFFSESTVDPKLLKIYVLVHDLQDGSVDRAEEILSEMKVTFGFNDCWLLCINSKSVPDSTGDVFWRSHMVSIFPSNHMKKDAISVPGTNLGCFLNEDDVNEISDLMTQICCKSIIPYMEQKIRSLNQQVVATRKGLRNQIKNLWWRKGRDEVNDSNSNAMYTYNSIETQIRVLADYAFMLCDYELALSNYRLISSDYKTDKAWKHYAGAQEMIGLSLFMLDQSLREAELSLETAFNTYQKLVPGGQKFSTRCALWSAEMYKAKGQYKDAAAVYSRAGTEESHLRAGILLEQAAYCFLRATPPMMRKYGFYLVLAGNRYNVCGQKKHALRAYMSVLTIFEGKGWNYINDHVLFNLGRLSTYLGDHTAAVEHFKKLISCSHQSPTNQASFLKEFFQAVQNAKLDARRMLRLDLPSVNKENVVVHFEDQRTYASSAASNLPEDMWVPLEAELVPSIHTGASNWLDGPSVLQSTIARNDSNQCVARETLTVDVEITNPLRIPLNLSRIGLICKFHPGTSSVKDGALAVGNNKNGTESAMADTLNSDEGNLYCDDEENPSITIVEDSIAMKPGEKYMLHLKVIPHEQGVLHILGIKWNLCGIVNGYQLFATRNIQVSKKKTRHDKFRVPQPHRCLNFFVNQHMPRLEVSLHGMPEKANSGELHRIVLELSNMSDVAIKNLKFCTSLPGIFLFGNTEDLDVEFPNCLEGSATDNIQFTRPILSEDVGSAIYTFPQSMILEGGSTLLWPLWLHARELEYLLLNNVLYYETIRDSNETTGMQFRTVRMSHTLQVFPSLNISVHISPCHQNLEQYLLRLDIANVHSHDSFWLRQVSCIGNRWEISPLLPQITDSNISRELDCTNPSDAAFISASLSPSQLLQASQTLSLFFHLKHTSKSFGNYNDDIISSIRLGSSSSSEPLIDVTAGPILKFHQCARALKQKEVQEVNVADPFRILEDKLDIILISEQQDVNSSGKLTAFQDAKRLATHHICYCSIMQQSPIVWLMEGPSKISHDFSGSVCEIAFSLTIKNFSTRSACVKVDMSSTNINSTPQKALNYQIGWYDISLNTSQSSESKQVDSKASFSPDSNREIQIDSPAGAIIWKSSNYFLIDRLHSGESFTRRLHLYVFAPGIYDLSGYHVSWELLPEDDTRPEDAGKDGLIASVMETTQNKGISSQHGTAVDKVSGSGCGHTYMLTVLDTEKSL